MYQLVQDYINIHFRAQMYITRPVSLCLTHHSARIHHNKKPLIYAQKFELGLQ